MALVHMSPHNLLGIYTVPAALPLHMRESIHNYWPLAIGPMGVSLHNVVSCSKNSSQLLSFGTIMTDPNDLVETIVLAFDMAILGDMVQQNECAGTAGHRSHTSCRSCLITTTERQDLLYDTLTNGCYRDEQEQIRKGYLAPKSKTAQKVLKHLNTC